MFSVDGLNFDHCFQKITDIGEYERFEALGFTLTPSATEHPYSLLSHILFFGPAAESINGPTQYLEFCWIRDVQGELAFARQDIPTVEERDLFTPGYSFKSSSSLETCLEKHRTAWADYQPSLTHRNYSWRAGEDSRRPGWNFLNFDAAPVDGVRVWATEYEACPTREPAHLELVAQAPHRNGVDRILGFVFNISTQEKRALSLLTGSDWDAGVLIMHDGKKIFCQQEHPEFAKLLGAKASPFTAVILGCSSMEQFCQVSGLEPLAGLSMAQIKSSRAESWDILVAEQTSV
jgi:hypothetical protein